MARDRRGKPVKVVDYGAMAAPLVNAIKSQQRLIQQQQATVRKLERALEDLERRLN